MTYIRKNRCKAYSMIRSQNNCERFFQVSALAFVYHISLMWGDSFQAKRSMLLKPFPVERELMILGQLLSVPGKFSKDS
jgi:hypothetical protein